MKEAFNTSLVTFKYDTQPEVYEYVKQLCFEALDNLNKTGDNVSAGNLAKGDAFMYGGDVNKWKKFVYGVLARYYNHQSNKSTYKPDSVIYYCNLSINDNADNAMVKFPDQEDLNGAATALMRLQDTYKLQTSEIAEGRLAGAGPLAARGDRPGDALDGELAVEIEAAVLLEAQVGRAEAHLGVVPGVEEVRREEVGAQLRRLVDGDRLDLRRALQHEPVLLGAQGRRRLRHHAAEPEGAGVADLEGEGRGDRLGPVGPGERSGCEVRHVSPFCVVVVSLA